MWPFSIDSIVCRTPCFYHSYSLLEWIPAISTQNPQTLTSNKNSKGFQLQFDLQVGRHFLGHGGFSCFYGPDVADQTAMSADPETPASKSVAHLKCVSAAGLFCLVVVTLLFPLQPA